MPGSVKCRYDETSTVENPIMYVEIKGSDGKTKALKIDVNKVNPSNATQAEILALTCHTYKDDPDLLFRRTANIDTNMSMAIHNGYGSFPDLAKGGANSSEDYYTNYYTKKLNWTEAYQEIGKLLFNIHDHIGYNQIQDMLDMFSKYPSKH